MPETPRLRDLGQENKSGPLRCSKPSRVGFLGEHFKGASESSRPFCLFSHGGKMLIGSENVYTIWRSGDNRVGRELNQTTAPASRGWDCCMFSSFLSVLFFLSTPPPPPPTPTPLYLFAHPIPVFELLNIIIGYVILCRQK